jgi:acid phosphatase type 7
LVQAIADARPAFVSIGGDIVYHGDDANDWKTWDVETAIWHKHGIAMYPVLGNHDLSGGKLALDNYFQHFPELKNGRYYAVRAGNALLLVLDSSLAELSGPQGEWFANKLDATPSDVEFVFILLHHPPYTSSSDEKVYGGGHSARSEEQELGQMLEQRQRSARNASWCSPAMFTTTSATNTMGSHILSAEAVGHTPTALHALRETHFQTTTSTIISCLSRSNTAS